MKAGTLSGLQPMALDKVYGLVYFGQTGFFASLPMQRDWLPIGEPYRVVPLPHSKRSVVSTVDFCADLPGVLLALLRVRKIVTKLDSIL